MARKDCFGSIKEVTLENGMTMTQTKPECRNCDDFRDCLFHTKVKDDERRQELIAKIIDHSEVHSNEIGSCLLDFLNRMYTNEIGTALFKNLILFYEVSQDDSSLTVTVPLSRSLLKLTHAEKDESEEIVEPFDPDSMEETPGPEQDLILRIILLQRRFPNNRKANMGLIAHEVASMFSSNDQGTTQITEMLSEQDARNFRKMDTRLRINWLSRSGDFETSMKPFATRSPILGRI